MKVQKDRENLVQAVKARLSFQGKSCKNLFACRYFTQFHINPTYVMHISLYITQYNKCDFSSNPLSGLDRRELNATSTENINISNISLFIMIRDTGVSAKYVHGRWYQSWNQQD